MYSLQKLLLYSQSGTHHSTTLSFEMSLHDKVYKLRMVTIRDTAHSSKNSAVKMKILSHTKVISWHTSSLVHVSEAKALALFIEQHPSYSSVGDLMNRSNCRSHVLDKG